MKPITSALIALLCFGLIFPNVASAQQRISPGIMCHLVGTQSTDNALSPSGFTSLSNNSALNQAVVCPLDILDRIVGIVRYTGLAGCSAILQDPSGGFWHSSGAGGITLLADGVTREARYSFVSKIAGSVGSYSCSLPPSTLLKGFSVLN